MTQRVATAAAITERQSATRLGQCFLLSAFGSSSRMRASTTATMASTSSGSIMAWVPRLAWVDGAALCGGEAGLALGDHQVLVRIARLAHHVERQIVALQGAGDAGGLHAAGALVAQFGDAVFVAEGVHGFPR